MNALRAVRWAAWGAVAVVGVLGLAAGGGWLVMDGPFGHDPVVADTGAGAKVPIGGSFAMTDHRSRAVTEHAFAGRPSLVFFGFTHCPDVCATTLADAGRRLEALGSDADRLAVLFVTVDPERDTPAQLAAYLEAFDPRITGLTGTPAQLAAMAATWRAHYRKVPDERGGYTMDHTALTYLMDVRGRFAGTIDPHESDEVAAAKLRRLLARPGVGDA